MKKKIPSCQCWDINREVNNGVGYLLQLWDAAVFFFPGCSRLFPILLWADSSLIGWKWPPECWCMCSSLSCIDKLITIFTLNGDLSVFPHLYYSLRVDDTTSAHLENKTHNRDDDISPQQPRQYDILLFAYQIGEQPIRKNEPHPAPRMAKMSCPALHTNSPEKVGPLQVLIKGHLIRPPPTSSAVDMTMSCEVIKSGTDIWKPY